MKWYIYAGAGAAVFIIGFLSGRGSVPRGSGSAVSISPPPTSRDGGVPEAVSKASVGGGSATTVLTCKAEPPPIPRTVYVKVPVGAATVECPQPTACPTLTCSGAATGTTGGSSAVSSAPVVPPQVVTVTKEIRSTLGIGGGVNWSKESGTHPAFGIVYQPWKEVEFSLSGTTVPSAQLSVYLRF